MENEADGDGGPPGMLPPGMPAAVPDETPSARFPRPLSAAEIEAMRHKCGLTGRCRQRFLKKLKRKKRRQVAAYRWNIEHALTPEQERELAQRREVLEWEARALRDHAHRIWLQREQVLEQRSLQLAVVNKEKNRLAEERRKQRDEERRKREEEEREKKEKEEKEKKEKEEREKKEREEKEEKERKEREERERKEKEERERKEKEAAERKAEAESARTPPREEGEGEGEDKGTSKELVVLKPLVVSLTAIEGLEDWIDKDRTLCPFYMKTGACTFGPECSRQHIVPTASHTIVCRNMFDGVQRPRAARDDELLDDELLERENFLFKEFFADVHTEMLSFGPLMQFKVCRNKSAHLSGNVYAQFQSLEDAVKARNNLNYRWFGGRLTVCDFVPVFSWKSAMCGRFRCAGVGGGCERGWRCNFLHCFQNPTALYVEADNDFHLAARWRAQQEGARRQNQHQVHALQQQAHSSRRSRRSRWEDVSATGRHVYPTQAEGRERERVGRAGSGRSEDERDEDDERDEGHRRRREGRGRRHRRRSEDGRAGRQSDDENDDRRRGHEHARKRRRRHRRESASPSPGHGGDQGSEGSDASSSRSREQRHRRSSKRRRTSSHSDRPDVDSPRRDRDGSRDRSRSPPPSRRSYNRHHHDRSHHHHHQRRSGEHGDSNGNNGPPAALEDRWELREPPSPADVLLMHRDMSTRRKRTQKQDAQE